MNIHNADSVALPTRRFVADYAADTPRHWCPGNPVVTHILNTYTLLVPGNEGFFIRTLKECTPLLRPEMQETVTQFSYQEGQHGVGHVRFWRILENQGYTIRGFQRRVDFFLYKIVERITPMKLRLSMVSCVEHVNAYIGHEFLTQEILRDADPKTRALFEWHFAEEIEHKNVAFDVLNEIAPSYLLRVLGALLVLPLFYLLTTVGTLNFLRQDKALFKRRTWSQWREHMTKHHHMMRRTLHHIGQYLRPSFHPSQLDDQALAQTVLDRYSSSQTPMLRPLERAA